MRALERAVVFLAFVLPLDAQAASWVSDSSFGLDPKSCGDVVHDRQTNAELSNRDDEWMFGFLTALVRAEGPSGRGGMTAEDFPGEIDALCVENPQMDIGKILEIFAKKHDLVKPETDRR
jgi:hypothetical protein